MNPSLLLKSTFTLLTVLLIACTPLFLFAETSSGERADASAQTQANAQAQTHNDDDCDDTDDRCEPAKRKDASIVKELDKATPEAAHTNVCDGVTCADGSCAATADECSAVAGIADSVCNGFLCDSGECATSEAMCGVMEEVPASLDADSDGDGLDDGTERANYNNSRSNRSTVSAPDNLDLDDDGDGIPTAAGKDIDKASPKLFDTLRSIDGDDDGDGIDTGATARAGGFVKIGDIKGEVRADADTGERKLSSIAVAARDLRDWTQEDREALSRLREEVAEDTPERASIRITERVLADEHVEELEADESQARVRYRAQMRLFGFIPLEREVEARADASGEVEVDYPWYRFLSTTPDQEHIRSLLLDTLDIVSER